jgi:hypothetical protein
VKRWYRVALLALLWIVCGIFTSGGWTAHFQYSYPGASVRSDLASSMFECLFGPVGFAATLSGTGFFEHGLCWTEASCAPIREAGRKRVEP